MTRKQAKMTILFKVLSQKSEDKNKQKYTVSYFNQVNNAREKNLDETSTELFFCRPVTRLTSIFAFL